MLAGATRLVMYVNEKKGAAIPLLIDTTVILSVVFFGGKALDRLDQLEIKVAAIQAINPDVKLNVLSTQMDHVIKQQDEMNDLVKKYIVAKER